MTSKFLRDHSDALTNFAKETRERASAGHDYYVHQIAT